MGAPLAMLPANSGGLSVPTFAIRICGLSAAPLGSEEYCYHSALQSVEFNTNLPLRRPPRAPVVKERLARPVEQAKFVTYRDGLHRHMPAIAPKSFPHTTLDFTETRSHASVVAQKVPEAREGRDERPPIHVQVFVRMTPAGQDASGRAFDAVPPLFMQDFLNIFENTNSAVN